MTFGFAFDTSLDRKKTDVVTVGYFQHLILRLRQSLIYNEEE